MFESSCSSCHAIGHSFTGPDLAHFPKRIPFEEGSSRYWYHDFAIKYIPRRIDINSGKIDLLYSEQWSDPYACNLINLFNKPVSLNITTDTSGADIFDVYNYIQNESDRLNLPLPSHAYLKDCTDSCYEYSNKIKELEWQKSLSQEQRERLIKENGEMTKVTPDTAWRVSQTPDPPPDFDKKVSPENFDATYYQFTIESFGWYNIDMLLEKLNNGVVESELFVRIVGEYRERISIFLIIPSVKVYGEGGPAEDGDKYAFFYKSGKIPLPQGVKAYILAVTEQDEKIAFSLKEFTTSTQQEFSMALETSTKEKFEAALKDFDTGRLHIKADKSKNADSIRKKDQDIRDLDLQLKDAEKLKPKNCDCDCGFEGDSQSITIFPQKDLMAQ